MCGIFGYVTNKEEALGPILIAAAEILPDLAEAVIGSLRGGRGRGVAPWDAGS
ncbi:MAG: hypothetical protein HXY42_15345 [Chloroflexi bacterium]|nr:hypothetical protein [Chloroflexota bacterium]